MSDLISRSALIEKAWDADTSAGYVQVVDVGDILEAPAVDAVEVVHGRWENAVCGSCGFDLRCLTDGENDLEQWVWDEGFDYCPNCGADMRERKDNG